MRVTVIGSFMMDLVVRTNKIPERGETVIGKSFARYPGGKGINQAIAASRSGARVNMVGALGDDKFGDEFLKIMSEENINAEFVFKDNVLATGVGLITLENDGSNRIIVVPGANLSFRKEDLDNLHTLIKKSNILVVQLEIDFDMIMESINIAYGYDIPVLLNPAPARSIPDSILSKLTYITPNEIEAEILTGIKVDSIENAELAAIKLLDKGINNVILTLGDRGAFIANNEICEHIPGYKVNNVVDTVAAGDSFNGAFVAGISSGKTIEESVKLANAAGAYSVSVSGAIPSIPFKKDIEQIMLDL